MVTLFKGGMSSKVYSMASASEHEILGTLIESSIEA